MIDRRQRTLGRRSQGFALILGVLAITLNCARASADEPAATQPAEAQTTDAPPSPETGPADAPPSEPPRARRQINYLSLERLDGAIELGSEFSRYRVTTGIPYQRGPFYVNSTRQSDSRSTFQEQLLLDLDSTIYDPRLLRVSGSVGLGLQQENYRERFDSRNQTDSSDGYLSSYDMRAEILPGKDISGSAYALRAQNNYTRPFLPTLLENRNEYGFATYYASDKFPMQLTYDHRQTDRDGDPTLYDDEHLTEDRLRYQASWITSPSHSLKFSYEYVYDDERYSGSTYTFQNTRNEWRVDDELLFGDQNQHRLDTNMRFQDEAGSYARDLYDMGTRMSLKHSDSLTTNYQYQFAKQEQGQLDFTSHRVDWQLIHQLYSNLTTTVDLFGIAEDVYGQGDSKELGASVNWSYTRNNRFGRFSTNLALSQQAESDSGGGERPIVAESAAFIDPLPVTLLHPDVIPWTIVVRGVERFRVYIPGVDYFITRVRNYTVLVRNPVGAIRNLSSVYVDYIYRIDAGASRDSTLVNLNIQQDFNNGFTPYYILDFRNDDRDLPTYSYNYGGYQLTRNRMGLRYRNNKFTAGAELDLLDDDIEPYTAYRLFSTLNVLRKPGKTIDLRADFAQYFFSEAIDGDSMVLDLALDSQAQLSRALDGYCRAAYRYEIDGARGRGIIQGVDLESGVSYRWGQFTFTASIEYDLLNIVDSPENGFTAWLKVRRDFPNLLSMAR